MDNKCFLAAIVRRRHAIGDASHPVVEQRRIDEACPDVQGFGEILCKTAKPPGFIGMHGAGEILMQQSLVEVDDTADKFGGENPDTAVIKEVDALRLLVLPRSKDRIIAKVR